VDAARRSDLRRLDGTPVRAVVVDDEPTLAELLAMALRYEGRDVRSEPGDTRVTVAMPAAPVAPVAPDVGLSSGP
jgi:two-component system, OmpR family, response regulator